MSTRPTPGQRAPDTSNVGDTLTVLTSLKEHMSPDGVPLMYQLYTGYVANPGEFDLPINLCEQQHKEPGQHTSVLMVTIQDFIERQVPRNDATLPNLKGVPRYCFSKQRKLCMKNNGQHGDNSERKVFSEDVGIAYMRLCGCDAPLRALLDYKNKDPRVNEIDDVFDALNLALATGTEVYANEAKRRNPSTVPMETGACLDRGKTYIRWHSTDPGEVKHARVIVDTGALYPPRKGQMTLYRNDSGTGKADRPDQDVLMPLPAFRILLMELINLRTNKVLFKWECADPESEPFYKPDQRDIMDMMKMIKQVEDERADRIKANRKAGAKKAAETRKRKREVEEGLADDVIDVDGSESSSSSEDVVERAKKRARTEPKKEEDIVVLY